MSEQTIFRAHRTERDRWTSVLNETIKDPRISFRATGLLIFLLSLPADWRASQRHIATCKREGRDAVISAWDELVKAGYVRKEIVRDSRGRIETTIWNIFESSHRKPGNQEPDFQNPDLPISANPALQKTEVEESTPNETPKVPKGDDATSRISKMQGFDQFWSAYPRKTGKQSARKAWQKHKCSAIVEEILFAIELQRDQPQWMKKNGVFIPHPATWLNGHRWEDEVSTTAPEAPRTEF